MIAVHENVVKSLARTSLGLFASIALHTLAFVQVDCSPSIELPEVEFELTEIEVLDPNQQLEGQTPPAPPPPPEPIVPPPPPAEEKKPEPPEEKGEKSEPKPEEEKPKPKPFGQQNTKVASLGPANSNVTMLLATQKIAKLPFAREIMELLALWPDFIFIIEGGGFHPLKDFNYIVIASPNLRYVDQTFLAVDYRLSPEEMKAGLERAARAQQQEIIWEEQNGYTLGDPVPMDENERDWDPRKFVFLDDSVALYVRAELISQILAGPDESKGKTVGNHIANLTRLRRFAATEPRAGLQLQARNIAFRLKGTSLNIHGLDLMIEAAKDPEVVLKMDFPDATASGQFVNDWNGVVPTIINEQIPFFARGLVRGLYDNIEIEETDARVALQGGFTKSQATLLFSQLAGEIRKQRRVDPQELAERQRKREELWQARNNGKLSPSEALEKLQTEQEKKLESQKAEDATEGAQQSEFDAENAEKEAEQSNGSSQETSTP